MVEAIGGNVSTVAQELSNNAISQEEFIQLFLAQLNNQDPLEPVDNSQFLAQMAEFTGLEQTRQLNENMTNLLTMNTSDQSLTLLGKTVQVLNGGISFDGIVSEVNFSPTGTSLNITNSSDETLSNVSIADVRLVQP